MLPGLKHAQNYANTIYSGLNRNKKIG